MEFDVSLETDGMGEMNEEEYRLFARDPSGDKLILAQVPSFWIGNIWKR